MAQLRSPILFVWILAIHSCCLGYMEPAQTAFLKKYNIGNNVERLDKIKLDPILIATETEMIQSKWRLPRKLREQAIQDLQTSFSENPGFSDPRLNDLPDEEKTRMIIWRVRGNPTYWVTALRPVTVTLPSKIGVYDRKGNLLYHESPFVKMHCMYSMENWEGIFDVDQDGKFEYYVTSCCTYEPGPDDSPDVDTNTQGYWEWDGKTFSNPQ